MEEERRDDRSIFKQVEAISSPCIYRRDLDICFRLLDCGGHRNNQSIYYHKASKINFTMTFKAVISSLDES
jgi:hypothetical protein